MMLTTVIRLAGLALLAAGLVAALMNVDFYPLLIATGALLMVVKLERRVVRLVNARRLGSKIQIEVESPFPVKVKLITPMRKEHIAVGRRLIFPFEGYGSYIVELGGRRWTFTVKPEA